MQEETKACATCGAIKPFSEFFKNYGKPKSACKECTKIAKRKYAENNADKIKAYSKKYYDENQEQQIEKSRLWRENNPDKLSAYYVRYYSENKDKICIYNSYYKSTHKDRLLDYTKEYRSRNPEKWAEYLLQYRTSYYKANKEVVLARCRDYYLRHIPYYSGLSRRYKHRKRAAEGIYTSRDIANLEYQQQNMCVYCGITFGKYHVDHIHPLSKDGTNWPSNLQLLCEHCNLSKGAKLPALYEKQINFDREAYNVNVRLPLLSEF